MALEQEYTDGRGGVHDEAHVTGREPLMVALKGELAYRDPGTDAYDAQQRTHILRGLRQRAATLGFDLVNRGTGEILQVGVS